MNQTNGKELILNAKEARNIQAEIFELLATIAELAKTRKKEEEDSVVTVQMDGGKF